MPSRRVQYTYPVPILAVVPAAASAAQAVRKEVREQTPTTLVARGSWLRIVGYPVTIRVAVAGVDGAAIVSIEGSSFGWGPIVNGAVQNELDQFAARLTEILQGWSAQAAPGSWVPGQ